MIFVRELQTALNSDFANLRTRLPLLLTSPIPIRPISQWAVLTSVGRVVHDLHVGTGLTDPATGSCLSLLE